MTQVPSKADSTGTREVALLGLAYTLAREVAKIMDSEINETDVYNLNGHRAMVLSSRD